MLRKAFSIAVLTGAALLAQAPRVGRPASEDRIKAIDITVFPDGRGLPAGQGTAAKGKDIYKEKCAVCHNDKAEGRPGQYPALVGGAGTSNTTKPAKTAAARIARRCLLTFCVGLREPFDDLLATRDLGAGRDLFAGWVHPERQRHRRRK